jgi:hypothetical protein
VESEAVQVRGRRTGSYFGDAFTDWSHFIGRGYTNRAMVAEIQQIHHRGQKRRNGRGTVR